MKKLYKSGFEYLYCNMSLLKAKKDNLTLKKGKFYKENLSTPPVGAWYKEISRNDVTSLYKQTESVILNNLLPN